MSTEDTGSRHPEIDKPGEDELLQQIRAEGRRKLNELYGARGLIPLQAGEKIEPVQWLCPGFLTVGGSALLSAKPKAGKSSLTMALALAAASGTGAVRNLTGGWLLDFQARPVKTCYLDTENSRGLTLRRMASLANEMRLDLDQLLSSGMLEVICLEGANRPPFLSAEEPDKKPDLNRDLAAASEWAAALGRKGQGYELVILDVMSHCYPEDAQGRDETSQGYISNFFKIINTIKKESGACVLLVHHFKKGKGGDQEMAAGSSQMLRTPETLCTLSDLPEELNPEDKPALFCLRTVGRQIERTSTVYLEAHSSQDGQCRVFREIEKPKKELKEPGRKAGARREAALEVLKAALLKSPETFRERSFTRREWTDAAKRVGPMSRSEETLRGYLEELVSAGRVELAPGTVGSSKLYKLGQES